VPDNGAGSSVRIALAVSAAVPLANGCRPVTISYRTTPNEKMSERWSTSWPLTCSGDMYPTVPRTAPAPVASITVVAFPASAPRGVEEDVPRLQVAVNDPLLMGGCQTLRDLDTDLHGLADRQGARAQPLP
jgi:hypothetical protein